MRAVGEYESFKRAMRSIVENSNRTKASKSTEKTYLIALKQYVEFVNSEDGLTKEFDPDDLIEEAKRDAEIAKKRIRLFYLWLQGEEAPDYKRRGKFMRGKSAERRLRKRSDLGEKG